MPCYSPLIAWESKEVNPTGKRSMVFKSSSALNPAKPIELPCGQCIGCRINKSKEWAMRCVHEASMHERNCFITLTFSPEELEKRENPWSLDVKEFQRFMKRLRKKMTPKNPYNKKEEGEKWKEFHERTAIRFFHCGEYGDKYKRPHYHAIIFNLDFDDKEIYSVNKRGDKLYISKTLEKLWPHGFATIGEANYETAAYTARYVIKKVNGDKALEHYNEIDKKTGEVLISRKPEYITMSRNGGIGGRWFREYKRDVFPKDYVTMRGIKMKPAKYYDKMYEAEFPEDMERIKNQRKEKIVIRNRNGNNDLSIERLKVREKVQQMKVDRLLRTHDKD